MRPPQTPSRAWARQPPRPTAASAPDLLADLLAVEARVELPIHTCDRVTVLRRRVELADPSAFTTAEGLEVYDPGYALVVFDSSFRLMPPGAWE